MANDAEGAIIMGPGGLTTKGGRKPRTRAEAAAVDQTETKDSDKTILHSQSNIDWQTVGKLTKGFNVVSNDVAEKWLNKFPKKIRKATVKEVKEYYR